MPKPTIEPRRFRPLLRRDLDRIPQIANLPAEQREVMKAVATVLPFRVNSYVVEELIDWDRVPDDPMFQLTFPQAEMLEPDALARMRDLLRRDAPDGEVREVVRGIQADLDPHPACQHDLNVPRLDGEPLPGMQHKYRETVLFFPTPGQTCHSYCTYCFRWAQFVGDQNLKFAAREVDQLVRYLRRHREVSDVLITGGDPLVMKTRVLRRYVEPLLARGLDSVTSIRLGTKAPAFWPHRFVTDDDADDLLRLFGEVRDAGKHLALMAHYSHPRELATPAAEVALQRIQDAGATVRCQAPLIRHVNDDADAWADMWSSQTRLGAVPYYMFVERDTGPKRYFEVPLARGLHIYRQALKQVSGLARTVRGPSMSATPGKVTVDGVAEVAGERVFALRFLQGRDPDWVGRPFFARYDERATWLDDLQPAFGREEFFFEPGLRLIARGRGTDTNDTMTEAAS